MPQSVTAGSGKELRTFPRRFHGRCRHRKPVAPVWALVPELVGLLPAQQSGVVPGGANEEATVVVTYGRFGAKRQKLGISHFGRKAPQ